jgi:hypothetical protein
LGFDLILFHLFCQISVAEERRRDNDLVLEQLLSPGMPSVAGFRFDYFNVVRPRVSHSPSINGEICESYLTRLEDRAISPAVLYIQVFALQVSAYALRFISLLHAWYQILIMNFPELCHCSEVTPLN